MEPQPTTTPEATGSQAKIRRYLPPINSKKYHVLLSVVAIFILGPLGGIAAAYMNFSIGFFVGGQVLAGILGSVVTYGYGPEGKHGANYMQSMAAAVAGMGAMSVLVQAIVWLGIPEPPTWEMILFFMCVGMFGVGVGMLYTPILVDRMQLTFPSGLAVANILRAMTDPKLLQVSMAKLGGGTVIGIFCGIVPKFGDVAVRLTSGGISGFVRDGATWMATLVDWTQLSASTLGAGMIVGARIGLPCTVVGAVGWWITPWLRAQGWLGPNDPFRKIGFIVALGAIVGAAVIDLSIIGWQVAARFRNKTAAIEAKEEAAWKKMNTGRLVAWVVSWGVALVIVATQVLHQPVGFVLFGIALVFVFLMVNGIADGVSDWNPISTAFVMAVILMASLGLKDAGVGLMCAAILLLACTVGVDMQQDRSTGWRLGTNRIMQFRYQVVGIVMGSILSVGLAKVFLKAYPVLRNNIYAHPETGSDRWQSAMTLKLVGSLTNLEHPNPLIIKGLLIGIVAGLIIGTVRKSVKANAGYKRFVKSGSFGGAVDFVFDAIVMPSPYAAAFGGFVTFAPTAWFGGGGVVASVWDWLQKRQKAGKTEPAEGEIPSDMSTTSLIGGGLIAGDSLAALGIGIYGLLKMF